MPGFRDFWWAFRRWWNLLAGLLATAVLVQYAPPDFAAEWRRMSLWWLLLPIGMLTVTAFHRAKSRRLLEAALAEADALLLKRQRSNWDSVMFFHRVLGLAEARFLSDSHREALVGMYGPMIRDRILGGIEEEALLRHVREWIKERL